MNQGKIISAGTPRNLLIENFKEVFIYLPELQVPEELIKKYQWNKRSSCIEIISENVEKTLSLLISLDISLQGLQVKSANLYDLFLKLTGHTLQES
jgi:ABC-2 type transport system ATP-binding protein